MLKFRVVFPDNYPSAMPEVYFETKVFHPLVEERFGHLQLRKDFGEWKHGKHWLIQVLLYLKKIFHLEKYYSLDGAADMALNRQALSLYRDNFEGFVDRCIECTEKSVRDQFREEAGSFRLYDKSVNRDKIQVKVESF